MSGERSRLTPVVAGLMVANAVIWVLLETVFTLPSVRQALQFDPARGLGLPWSVLTYLFVHPGLISLGINLVLLANFGPPVERRMGGIAFLGYYLACGAGAALFALGLTSFSTISPLQGASGAVLGTALAFLFAWPDARLVLDPIPVRPRVQTLVIFLAASLVGAAFLFKGGQHFAYLGGLAAGYFILRAQMLSAGRKRVSPAPVPVHPVMKPVSVAHGGPPVAMRPARPPKPQPDRQPADELDRVLDKISALGMQSLTPDERQFLDRMAERKRETPD